MKQNQGCSEYAGGSVYDGGGSRQDDGSSWKKEKRRYLITEKNDSI